MKQYIILLAFFLINTLGQAEKVYTILLEGNVDPSMVRLVENGFKEADTLQTDYIYIELNTYGGGVQEADIIRRTILDSDIPTPSRRGSDTHSLRRALVRVGLIHQ